MQRRRQQSSCRPSTQQKAELATHTITVMILSLLSQAKFSPWRGKPRQCTTSHCRGVDHAFSAFSAASGLTNHHHHHHREGLNTSGGIYGVMKLQVGQARSRGPWPNRPRPAGTMANMTLNGRTEHGLSHARDAVLPPRQPCRSQSGRAAPQGLPCARTRRRARATAWLAISRLRPVR